MTNKIPVRTFRADWDKLGKPAQLISCFEMAAFADALISVHDGTDHVAEYQVKIAKNCQCKVYEVRVAKQVETLVMYGQKQTN